MSETAEKFSIGKVFELFKFWKGKSLGKLIAISFLIVIVASGVFWFNVWLANIGKGILHRFTQETKSTVIEEVQAGATVNNVDKQEIGQVEPGANVTINNNPLPKEHLNHIGIGGWYKPRREDEPDSFGGLLGYWRDF